MVENNYDIRDPEALKEEHSKYQFDKSIVNSKGVDENGEEYNFDFRVEGGKVHYEKIDEDKYLVVYTIDQETNNIVQSRYLSFDQLSEWFYNPSNSYFNDKINDITIIEG